jgi:hypothetical protein
MSAAAARRRKQLAARQAAEGVDTVTQQLNKLLSEEDLDEATAYEALQLAQSQVRKKVHALDFVGACDLAYKSSLSLLKKKRVSVASQLLTVLVEVLRETHTEETDTWINRIVELNTEHATAMADQGSGQEAMRLLRLQRDWIRSCMGWSSDLGNVRFGNNKIHELYAQQCWKVAELETEDMEEQMDMRCEAVQHMMLAEKPEVVITWLKTLPAPTEEETKQGHTCPPALRDALLSRAVLLACAMENLRDASTLIKLYMNEVEERKIDDLKASYTKKDDGLAPSHIIFSSMLVRICEKDMRTGPLFSWLLRSFKRELDRMYKPGVIHGFTTKIGKLYFNIQPPPTMMNMMENMMGMMGGGGGAPAINPAMMQAAMAQMQQGGMM